MYSNKNKVEQRLKINNILFDKYKIIQYLGQGSMSIVYKIESLTKKDDFYVLKEFFPQGYVFRTEKRKVEKHTFLTNEKKEQYKNLKKLFEYEAQHIRTLSKKRCPGLPIISKSYSEMDGNYIIMDYRETITLDKYMLKIKDFKRFQLLYIELFLSLLNTLDCIHKSFIYHQDIKMENILLTMDNQVLLIDFGSSKILYNKTDNTYFNMTSLEIAAIEQIKLSYPPEVSAATDIYNLASVMYCVLTSTYPISSIIREKCIETSNVDPYIPLCTLKKIKIDKKVLKCIDKALSFYPEDRYQDVKHFSKDLKAIL